ncbi:YcnI family copper-binding membrane protein [Motilibacter aurantiacus]|uniref:YcnI family copper-binding membrane protein n=1 Tax=Motilibacter aurantiacus TaxID=2714955 RepID=UPI002F2B2743
MLRSYRRAGALAGVGLVLLVATAGPAAAHVTVNPSEATQGGYAALTFRVPTESDSASTTKLAVQFPIDTPFASVSVKPHPGWTYEVTKETLATPIEAHGQQITEAVSQITWTATGDNGIKPGEFDEFDVSAGPMPDAEQVVFKAVQSYSDGEDVAWVQQAAPGSTDEPDLPAPVLTLKPAAAQGADGDTAAADPGSAPAAAAPADAATDSDVARATWIGVAGLVVGLAAGVLGALALRRRA